MSSGGDNRVRWIVGTLVTLLGICVGAAVPIYLANRDDGETAGGSVQHTPDRTTSTGGGTDSNFDPRTPASISINPIRGGTGTSVTVDGSGFEPNEEIELNFSTTSIGRTRANAGGSFTTTVKVPSGYQMFAPHDFDIVALGRSSVKSDRQSFHLSR